MIKIKKEHYENINIHVYPSPIINESRILKITKSIARKCIFDKIYILGILQEGLKPVEQLDDVRVILRINTGKFNSNITFFKILRIIIWSWKIIRHFKKAKITCINAHSLSTLPLCVLIKIIKRAKLIYDTHELETETDNMRGIRKIIAKAIERILIMFVDETVVVSESIAQWYKRKYSIDKVWVVRNVPIKSKLVFLKENLEENIFRDIFNIPPEHMIFIYQGQLSKERGIPLILKVFTKVAKSRHIIFMGKGELEKEIVQYSEQHNNIHYYPPVSPDMVIRHTRCADIGVHFIPNTCLNHYYCLPNKVWEYIMAGIPIIVSNFPEMRKLVEEYKCGWYCVPVEEEVLNLINCLKWSQIFEKREQLKKSQRDFGWHIEEKTLFQLYNKLNFIKSLR